jgi:16S rRNA (guanine966-N2)-methyltransferase
MRETLFNWLRPVIVEARCLDLFAGSGALGFEAASRGAAEVVMVEQDRVTVERLRANRALLGASCIRIVQADALRWLTNEQTRFDVIFLDPPFGQGLLARTIEGLGSSGYAPDGAWIYLEAERSLGEPPLPSAWELHRKALAGGVGYYLARSGASPVAAA